MTRKQHNIRAMIANDISPPDGAQEKAPRPASILPAVRNLSDVHFENYTWEQLLAHKIAVDAAVEKRRQQMIETMRIQTADNAAALGITVEALLGIERSGERQKRFTAHKRGAQPARYRGPGGEEWSGCGQAPRWMKPLLAKGKTKADFLIGEGEER